MITFASSPAQRLLVRNAQATKEPVVVYGQALRSARVLVDLGLARLIDTGTADCERFRFELTRAIQIHGDKLVIHR